MLYLVRTPSYNTDLEFTLRRQFKKTSFRPHQREIIMATLDRYDVYVQAATSFGKSLCFQLPALIDHGSESSWQSPLPHNRLGMSGVSLALSPTRPLFYVCLFRDSTDSPRFSHQRHIAPSLTHDEPDRVSPGRRRGGGHAQLDDPHGGTRRHLR